MPIVHPCAHADCEILTMGTFCLEHERERGQSLLRRVRRTVPRLATMGVLVAAAVAGAAVRSRLG